MEKIKIAIVDDDRSYKESLKNILGKDPRILLYREYESGLDFIRDIGSPFKPDVCLIDIKLGDMSGIECAKRVREKYPEMPVVIMTAYPDVTTFYEARKIGTDYIEKSSRAASLFERIILSSKTSAREKIFSLNESCLNYDDLKLICQLDEVKKRCGTLSPSQKKILKLKKEGKSVKEISDIMGVHTGTVATQISRIYEKLNLPQLLDYI